ncbi:MAG: hypothetical protein WC956_04400 [bacterium]
MALNQQYTWHDFLREHPEHKQKKTKRMSPEGKKAFDAAYKAYIKKYLVGQVERFGKQIAKTEEQGKKLSATVRELRKAKKWPKAKLAQEKAGRRDAAIVRLKKQKERATAAQKSF